MNAEEKALFQKIKSNLHVKGDRILLTNVHDGDWLSACINPTDVFSSMELETVTVKNVTVINGAVPMSGEADWGLYFVYPDNKIEYYAFPNDKILSDTSRGWPGEGKNCAKRENAYLEVKEMQEDRLMVRLVGN